MACCGSRTGPAPYDSRYPVAEPDRSRWARSPNVVDQFPPSWGTAMQSGVREDAPFTYAGANLAACQFPVGGFGAGYVILGGDGTLQAYNIVNQVRGENLPMHCMPAGFFAVTATPSGSAAQSVLLASPETYTADNCALPPTKPARVTPESVARLETLPGITSLQLTGRYPIAEVAYTITGFPVTVALEAYSPMAPLDNKNSSLPVGIFTFTLTNSGTAPVAVRLLQSQQNLVGWNGQDNCVPPNATAFWGGNVNTATAAGVAMANPSKPSGASRENENFGTLAVQGVPTPSAAKTTVILDGASEEDIYAKFVAASDVAPVAGTATSPSAVGTSYCGGVVQTVTVAPGAQATVTFVLAWSFPNRSNAQSCRNPHLPTVLGNNYNNWFADASAAADYAAANIASLAAVTRTYRDIIFRSSVPPVLLDSAAGKVAHLRCPTMWQTEAGIVLGTEGNGCCPLNCTHVYGYTMLMERLFPDLAKDMRVSDFVRNYNAAAGGCTMRYGTGGWAIDGALACVVKTYIVVRQADSALKFLPTVWANVKGQMDLVIKNFDIQGDGVIRSAQQNTYDTPMNGANTFIGSYYVTALRACSRMAELMGDDESSKDYALRAATASKNYDVQCWREDFGYYYAVVDATDCKYS
jgi:non-lysosomal glucosylceramidase